MLLCLFWKSSSRSSSCFQGTIRETQMEEKTRTEQSKPAASCSEKSRNLQLQSQEVESVIFVYKNSMPWGGGPYSQTQSLPWPTTSTYSGDRFPSTVDHEEVPNKDQCLGDFLSSARQALHGLNTRVSQGDWEGRRYSSALTRNCLGSRKSQQKSKVNAF